MTHRYRRRLPQAGFTLVEIAVVIVIIAVLMSMALVMTRGVAAAQKRALTATRLATVEAALIQYVQINRRLPCPALGNLPSTNASAGIESPGGGGTCTNAQQHGVVPWVTLGISEGEATDGWDRRITYRVDPSLVLSAGALDMSWCDPAGTGAMVGTACNPACTNSSLGNCTPPATYLSAKGLHIKEVKTNELGVTTVSTVMSQPSTGAAYVLISHGESGGGGYLSSGVRTDSSTTDGTEERNNYADLALRTAVGADHYLDGGINDVAGAGHFDDIVFRPSVLSLAAKAGLGPRSH